MVNLADLFKSEQQEQKDSDTGGVSLWKATFKVQKETSKSRIRFLVEFDHGIALKWHKSKNIAYGEYGLDSPCWQDEHFGYDECPFCDDIDRLTKKNGHLYIWPVWDYEESLVRLYVGRNNPKTLAGKLFDFYEENGSILGRDFTVKLTGMDYSLTPSMKESPFQFQGKVKPPTEEAMVKSLVLHKNRDMANELGYVPSDSIIPPTTKVPVEKDDIDAAMDKALPKKKVPGKAVPTAKAAPKTPAPKKAVVEDSTDDDIKFEDD